MRDRPLTILILSLSVYQKFVNFSSRAADIDCDTGCPFSNDVYNLTCTSSSTGNCNWFEGSTIVMACAAGGNCDRQELGYSGYRISDNNYVLQIDNLKAATVSCKLGSDPQVSCSVEVVSALPVGTIVATCSSHVITCSGINDHGTPAVTLELRDGTDVLASTTTGGSISSTQSGSAGKTYTCAVTGTGSKCLSATSVDVTCSITPPRPVTSTTPKSSPLPSTVTSPTTHSFPLPGTDGECLIIILVLTLIFLLWILILLLVTYFVKRKWFRCALIVLGVIAIIVGITCTAVYFAVCLLDTPLGTSAAAFSIIVLIVGVVLIVIGVLYHKSEKREEKRGEKRGKKPEENRGKKPGEKPGERPEEKPGEKPGEKRGKKPGEKPEEKSEERPNKPV